MGTAQVEQMFHFSALSSLFRTFTPSRYAYGMLRSIRTKHQSDYEEPV